MPSLFYLDCIDLLAVLAGHPRYAHITALRSDGVNPNLLGMNKIVSEDSMHRAFLKMKEDSGIAWLQNHLNKCYAPLLLVPWILDVDTTVKVLYGKQEGAVIEMIIMMTSKSVKIV